MAEFPKITNDKLFMAKIYEALCTATNFQIGSKSMMINDGYVLILDANKDWICKVQFVKNNTITLS